ncbi:MAG: histidine kinase dimerization/phospho-acceptor domain-containing protein [Opitutaceae bacterium]|nr:histidine kinase dimerization/phospho-acceptor domain-containing protein [Opitutaceae bacterium]
MRPSETARTQLAAHAQELENKVRDRTAQLEETVAQLNTFSYSLSHDMRAPLRSIQGFAEMVAPDYADKLGPEGVNHLRRIISAAVRLDRLIHDVLNFSRVSRQELAVELPVAK